MVHHKGAVCLPRPHFTNVFKGSFVLRRSFLDLSELPSIVWVVLITHWLFMHVRERAIREKTTILFRERQIWSRQLGMKIRER